jgi:hypothetical protein
MGRIWDEVIKDAEAVKTGEMRSGAFDNNMMLYFADTSTSRVNKPL